jgi:biotin carboxylase
MTLTTVNITAIRALLASLRDQSNLRAPVAQPDDAAALNTENPKLRLRILIERAIIRRAVEDILAAGYLVSVYYGDDDYGIRRSANRDAIMAEVGACDEEWLNVMRADDTAKSGYRLVGTIELVYGNDGWDVIADYHSGLEQVLKGANDLATALGDLL